MRGKINNSFFLLILLALLVLSGCGGSSAVDETDSFYSGTDTSSTSDETINTEKLIGTPFEGLTSGDDFPDYYFQCGQYQTLIIESFPIHIFAAFFTEAEEMRIQEGIDIANEGMGFEAYELTNQWSNNIRVIMKVVGDYEWTGVTAPINSEFKFPSEVITPDWTIRLEYPLGISEEYGKWIVAHELGHSSGIEYHNKIDYDMETLSDLEDNSLMGTSGIYSSSPALDDYNTMMLMQGQIMIEHLGDTNFPGGVGFQNEDECSFLNQ